MTAACHLPKSCLVNCFSHPPSPTPYPLLPQAASGDLPDHEVFAMKTNMKTFLGTAKNLVQFVSSRRDVYMAIQQVEDLHSVLREQLEALPSVSATMSHATTPRDSAEAKARRAKEEAKKSATLTIARVLQQEGFVGFYRGVSSGLVSYAATWSTYYYAYHRMRVYLLAQFGGRASTLLNLANSTFAGVVTCVVTNPLWVVNTRLKLQQGSTRSSRYTLVEVQRMIAEEGLSSCFKGLGASLILVANPAIQFLLVEKMNDFLRGKGYTERTITPMHRFAIGAISKLISTLATYPLQVIKTRQQEAKNPRRSRAGSGGGGGPNATYGVAPRRRSPRTQTSDSSGGEGGGSRRSRGMQRVIEYTATGSPRVRMQQRRANDLYARAPQKNSGSNAAVIWMILQREGIGGLYRGLSVKIIQTVLTSAFLMAFQDVALKLLARLAKVVWKKYS